MHRQMPTLYVAGARCIRCFLDMKGGVSVHVKPVKLSRPATFLPLIHVDASHSPPLALRADQGPWIPDPSPLSNVVYDILVPQAARP